jgi:hypothetical protein
MNAAAKSAELGEIGEFATTELMGAGRAKAMGNEVIQADVVIEGVWPEAGAKGCTSEHGAQSIANSLVGAFAGAILMGRVRAGKLDLITEISESGADFVALAEFTATIHTNIFVGAGGRIVGEPLVEPVHRGGLGSEGTTKDATTEVVSDENVTGFAIEADQVVESSGSFAPLDHESEIDG